MVKSDWDFLYILKVGNVHLNSMYQYDSIQICFGLLSCTANSMQFILFAFAHYLKCNGGIKDRVKPDVLCHHTN